MIEILISSSVLILVLAILRLVLRDKISARLQYALWLLVLVRLLVPVSFFHSPVSVAEAAKPVTERAEAANGAIVYFPKAPVSAVYTSPENEMLVIQDADPYYTAERVIHLTDAARWVWYAGVAVMAAWFLFVNLRFARRLKKSRTPYDADAKPPVYVADGIPSPCLFGLFRPAVYLTEQAAADPAQAAQIVAHERTHLRHGDLLWALLRSVCLAVWWFDPFVWLAAALSRQDCELACDEGTIKALGEDARFDYGRTLVGMAKVGARPSDLLCGATTMTSGKKTLKARVARIAQAPKTSAAVAVAVLVIAAVAVGCTYGGPAAEPDTPDAYVPMLMFNGELYRSTGRQLAGDVDPAGFIGYITSVVPPSEHPTEEGQANFGEVGDPYAITDYGLTVMVGLEWEPFVPADGDADPEPFVRTLQSAELRIIDPYSSQSSASRTVMITDPEDMQALYYMYETGRAQAVPMDDRYDPGYGPTLYSVDLVFRPTVSGDGYTVPAPVSFQMWSGGEFLFYDESDPANDTPAVWRAPAPDGEACEALLTSLAEKYGAPAADAPSSIRMNTMVYYEGGVMHFADGSPVRLYDVDITPEGISFTVKTALTAAPTVSAVTLDGKTIGTAGMSIITTEDGGTYCHARWSETLSLSELKFIACFGGEFGVNGYRVSGEPDPSDPPAPGIDAPSSEADTQAALAALGDYGVAGKEPAFVVGSNDYKTLTAVLTGQTGTPVSGVQKLYGMDGPELCYSRYYADDTRAGSITADVFEAMREDCRSRSGDWRDVAVNGHEALAYVMGAPYLIWYDAERDVIFEMLYYENADGKLGEPLLEAMLALAETVG